MLARYLRPRDPETDSSSIRRKPHSLGKRGEFISAPGDFVSGRFLVSRSCLWSKQLWRVRFFGLELGLVLKRGGFQSVL